MDTWGDKPKSQIDNSTVDQEIDSKIQSHLDDPDAHILEGQALQSHKASEIIDHLARSIVTDKLIQDCVTAVESDPSALVADCVVAVSGGDYDNLQDAIDDGNKVIYVKSGTYTISADIVVPSDVSIIGENKYTTIFDFNNSSYSFKFIGVDSAYLFNNLLRSFTVQNCASYPIIGNYIDNFRIVDCYFKDNSHLIRLGFDFTLSRVGELYIIDNDFEGGGDIKISGGPADNIKPFYFSRNRSLDCSSSFLLVDSAVNSLFSIIDFNIVKYSSLQSSGFAFEVYSSFVTGNFIYNAYNGIAVSDSELLSNRIFNSGNCGIYALGNDCYLHNNFIDHVGSGSDGCGILVDGYDEFLISGNVIWTPSEYGLYINNGGHHLVSNNRFRGLHGSIMLDTDSDECLVSGNYCFGGSVITDNGSANVLEHNFIT